MNNDNILQFLSKIDKINFLDIPSNIQINKHINSFHTFKFSLALPTYQFKEVTRSYGIKDSEQYIFKLIRETISKNIVSSLIESLLKTNSVSYIHIKDLNPSHLINLNYKGFITNQILTNRILEIEQYYSIINSNTFNLINSTLYKYGDYHNMEFWINLLQKYNDSYILFFDNIYLNYKDFNMSIRKEDTLEISIDMAFDKNKSNILYLIGDETSDDIKNSYKGYKRNQALNNILEK